MAGTNMFGEVRERHVTFCIDTSGTMYRCLDTAKEHLIETLEKRSHQAREDDTFNIIEFSSTVLQWADEMVSWKPETVAIAAQWIRNLIPKTGTNTRDALLTALSDTSCDSVYLLTDSLPDQHTEDVMDCVMRLCRSRPIHCVYIQRDVPEQAAVEFLQELAMETFGSFHIVTMTDRGQVESITPVYRAEKAAERIIRTTSGNILPSSHKLCSVGTSLDGPPVTTVPVAAYGVPVIPPWPYCLYPWPYRYYYSLPQVPFASGTMRYRPAKAWMKHTEQFMEQIVGAPIPGAGALLIGSRVLARWHNDGFFYMGTVKSQILDNQFLVEFGPCKHGKFIDTEYQETYVYDIVSHSDALRHPVLLDDKVLAPWESEGERYAPGVVISGHEKRMADGGEPDQQLVVTFHDGKTASVSKDKAMWIPHDLYDRITFEIRLPKNVRKDFATQDLYPYYNSFGYPASGSLAFPAQFECNPLRGVGWGGGLCRGYPWMAFTNYGLPNGNRLEKNGKKPSGKEGGDEIIPGTNLTKSELNRRVLSQISQNKTMTAEDDRLLKKRVAVENTSLRKSVSFADLRSSDDARIDGNDSKDSGHGSQTELNLTDDEFDTHSEGNESKTTRDAGVGTNYAYSRSPSSLRKSRSASPSRQWKYWKNDPAPSLTDPMHYGPYRQGPYRDCIDCPSVLLRDAKKSAMNTVEWTSPFGRVVDPFACYKYQPSVKDSLGYFPHPPGYNPPKQGPGVDLSDALGSHQRAAEVQAESRREFRQRQVLAREIGWQHRVADDEHARQMALDYRRQKTELQIQRDQSRIENQASEADRHLAARRQTQEQLNRTMQENAANLGEREARRLAGMTLNKINRNLQNAEHQNEVQMVYAQRQANREMQNIARNEANLARISEQELQAAAQYRQNVRTKATHTERFRKVEEENQRRKQLQIHVADQSQAIHRSQIFP